MLKIKDLDYVRGDTKIFDVFATRPDPTTGEEQPTDLTGGKVWFTAKRLANQRDDEAIFRLTSLTSAIVIIDPVGGQARITIPPTSSPPLPEDAIDLLYDVQVKDAVGVVDTIQAGVLHVKVLPDITRSTT